MNGRYDRQIALPEIGEGGQKILEKSRVLVVGVGGLGCACIQNLAASGIGTIGIADGDYVEESNLPRQCLYVPDDCKKSKAFVASSAIKRINPNMRVLSYAEFLSPQNAKKIFAEEYDAVIDCTDNIEARYLISDIALAKNIPHVYASIHKFEGQVAVFNYKSSPSYRCLFSMDENANAIPSCATSGVLGVLPNILGLFQAMEVFKILLHMGDVLSGKILLYNALRSTTNLFSFSRDEKQIAIGKQNGRRLMEGPALAPIQAIDAFHFMNHFIHKEEAFIIDIREEDEQPKLLFENVLRIPFSQIKDRLSTLDKEARFLLCCQSGRRSEVCSILLKEQGFKHVSHLQGGISSLRSFI